MKNSRFCAWLIMILALVQDTKTHEVTKTEGSVCSSRFSYNLMMLNKMTDIEKEIRDTVRSLTEQVLLCSNSKCQEPKPVPSSCPAGAYKFNKSCYLFGNDILTWIEAMEKCKKEFGGYLAVIKSADENNFLKQRARSQGRKDDRLWIGGSDIYKEGEWRWMTTTEIISSNTFTDWWRSQPDNGSGNEHCLEFHGNADFKWNDDQCFNRHKYICERDL